LGGKVTPLTRHQKFLLGSLSLGHMVNDWVSGTIWLLAPAIAASMGLGPTEVGLILTINGLGAGLAYIPAGIFADRSTRPGYLMLLSFWWVAIGYFSATLAPGFWAVTLLLAFGVMGDAFWHPIATGVLVKEMPKRRAQVLGIHAVGGSIGAEVLGPLATGFLLGFFDWQTSLQILVIPALAMGILFVPIAMRIRAESSQKMADIDLGGLARHWLSGRGKLLMLMMVLYNLSLMAILGMTPLYLQSEHGLSSFNAGLIFATMLLVGTAFQPIAGKYSDRRGRKPITVTILLIACFFAVIAGLASNLVWAIFGLLPAAALLTTIRPVVLATAVDYSDKSEATTLGIVFTILDGVGMMGALFAGLIGEFSLNYAFLLAAGFAMASALVAMILSFDFASGRAEALKS
jgi:MFS family permease